MRADARARDELARLLEFRKQRAVSVTFLQVYYSSRSSETCRSRYRYKIVKIKIIPQSPFNWTCRVASRPPNFCDAYNPFSMREIIQWIEECYRMRSPADMESRLITTSPIDIVMGRSLEARPSGTQKTRDAPSLNGPYAVGSHRRVLISRDLKIRSH